MRMGTGLYLENGDLSLCVCALLKKRDRLYICLRVLFICMSDKATRTCVCVCERQKERTESVCARTHASKSA